VRFQASPAPCRLVRKTGGDPAHCVRAPSDSAFHLGRITQAVLAAVRTWLSQVSLPCSFVERDRLARRAGDFLDMRVVLNERRVPHQILQAASPAGGVSSQIVGQRGVDGKRQIGRDRSSAVDREPSPAILPIREARPAEGCPQINMYR